MKVEMASGGGSPRALASRSGQHNRHDCGSGIADDDRGSDLEPLATFGTLVGNARWATFPIDRDLRHPAAKQNLAAGRLNGLGKRVGQTLRAAPDVAATRAKYPPCATPNNTHHRLSGSS